jgi:energy-coupling factor transporter ATP-binding protein EcfA2
MAELASLSDRRLARMANNAPRVPWQDFVRDVFDWHHGEHVAMIGPTGQGKTTLMRSILPLHPFAVIMATKPRDRSMTALERSGFVIFDRWRSIDPRAIPKRILWPDASRIDSEKAQAAVFRDAFARIYREGAWTIAIDELWYMHNVLKLGPEIRTYMLQSRALDISVVNSTQRPAWVPTEVYDQSTHLFFWRNNDARAQRRLGEINMIDSDIVRDVIGNLERHQTLYIDARTGQMVRTRCPLIVEGR